MPLSPQRGFPPRLPVAVEPVRHRRFIVIARARAGRTETPSAPQDVVLPLPFPPITVLRTARDATFDERWRALQGY